LDLDSDPQHFLPVCLLAPSAIFSGRDKAIPGTQARSTTIPEELGRISYLLSDKTGTLTMNMMIFKKLHLGTAAYSDDSFNEV